MTRIRSNPDTFGSAVLSPPVPTEGKRGDPTFTAFGSEMLALVRVVLHEAEREAAGRATGDEVQP